MSDRWVSLSIKATKQPGDAGVLYEASWALLAATIQKNAKHASAKEILGDYLDETLDDGKDLADAKHLEYACLSPAGACDVQAAVAEHWFELAIALAEKELAALCREHGYEMKPLRASARELATAERKVPFVPNGDAIVGIQRKAKPLVLVDAGEELPIDDADLTPAARKLARDVAKTGRCACAFCEKIRTKKAVVAKPSKAAKPAPSANVALEGFDDFAKALRNPQRCGWFKLADTQLTRLPAGIRELIALQALSLDEAKITEVPAAILRLTKLRRLSLSSLSKLAVPLPNLGELTELQSLALRRIRLDGGIDAIDFSRLKKLEELDLGVVKMTAFPATLRGLPNLKKLNIDSAKLADLPRTFATLTGLTELQATNSAFTAWPRALNDLPRLKTIDFENSQLTKIDALRSLPALEWLSLSGTQLTKLPGSIADLPKLKTLHLSDTQIAQSEIDALKRKRPNLQVIT